MITNVEELLTARGDVLRQIRGQKVVDIWLAWFDEWNEVHTCSPVVLQLESGCLELWTIYVCEFSITWNTINLSQAPFSWLDEPQGKTRWVNNSEPLLQNVKGKIIQDISILAAGKTCNGICFKLDDRNLVIQNGLDELVIADSITYGPVAEKLV